MNSLFIHSFQTSGPSLPIPLSDHSMVRLGKGQAILGGYNKGYQSKIYRIDCSNRNCSISLLKTELSLSMFSFVAIPIPDKISGCLTGRMPKVFFARLMT